MKAVNEITQSVQNGAMSLAKWPVKQAKLIEFMVEMMHATMPSSNLIVPSDTGSTSSMFVV